MNIEIMDISEDFILFWNVNILQLYYGTRSAHRIWKYIFYGPDIYKYILDTFFKI